MENRRPYAFTWHHCRWACGIHAQHHNEDEVYYILEGTGIANDNGKEIEIKAGSVLFTKTGSGHGLKNTGNIPLKFLAFMVKH